MAPSPSSPGIDSGVRDTTEATTDRDEYIASDYAKNTYHISDKARRPHQVFGSESEIELESIHSSHQSHFQTGISSDPSLQTRISSPVSTRVCSSEPSRTQCSHIFQPNLRNSLKQNYPRQSNLTGLSRASRVQVGFQHEIQNTTESGGHQSAEYEHDVDEDGAGMTTLLRLREPNRLTGFENEIAKSNSKNRSHSPSKNKSDMAQSPMQSLAKSTGSAFTSVEAIHKKDDKSAETSKIKSSLHSSDQNKIDAKMERATERELARSRPNSSHSIEPTHQGNSEKNKNAETNKKSSLHSSDQSKKDAKMERAIEREKARSRPNSSHSFQENPQSSSKSRHSSSYKDEQLSKNHLKGSDLHYAKPYRERSRNSDLETHSNQRSRPSSRTASRQPSRQPSRLPSRQSSRHGSQFSTERASGFHEAPHNKGSDSAQGYKKHGPVHDEAVIDSEGYIDLDSEFNEISRSEKSRDEFIHSGVSGLQSRAPSDKPSVHSSHDRSHKSSLRSNADRSRQNSVHSIGRPSRFNSDYRVPESRRHSADRSSPNRFQSADRSRQSHSSDRGHQSRPHSAEPNRSHQSRPQSTEPSQLSRFPSTRSGHHGTSHNIDPNYGRSRPPSSISSRQSRLHSTAPSRARSVNYRSSGSENHSGRDEHSVVSFASSVGHPTAVPKKSLGSDKDTVSDLHSNDSVQRVGHCKEGDIECYKAHIQSLEDRISELETGGCSMPKSLSVVEHSGRCDGQRRYTLETDIEDPVPREPLELSFCSRQNDPSSCYLDAVQGSSKYESGIEQTEDDEEFTWLIDEYSRFLPCARSAIREHKRTRGQNHVHFSDLDSGGNDVDTCKTEKDEFNDRVDVLVAAILYDKHECLKSERNR